MERYLVPQGYGEAEYIEKRSRFIGRVWRISSEAEALAHINEIREKHWDATHNVYAYSVKENGIMRYSDDGEPSGTSGMPTLNVFRAGNIQDFCCVVTRYFGGTLLGAGGLVRAYSKTAAMALESAGKAEMRILINAALTCTYPQYERLKAEILRLNGVIDDTDYGADITMYLSLTEEQLKIALERVTEITAGKSEIVTTGETLKAVPITEKSN